MTNRKKILIINYEFPPIGSGGGRQSMYLAQHYAQNHDVYVLTAGFDRFGLDNTQTYQLERLKTSRRQLDRCSTTEMLSFLTHAWRRLSQLTQTFQPDIIHIFFAIPTGLLIFHPALKNIPAVVSMRGSDVPGHRPDRFQLLYPIIKPLVRRVWKKAHAVVCNSTDLRDEVHAIQPDLNVDVIGNGVDTQLFHPAETPKQTKQLTLLYVGRLIPLKRIDAVIQALPTIIKNHPHPVRFQIVGSGNQKQQLQNLVNQLNLQQHVEFLGQIQYQNMAQQYRQADIYIQLSQTEGMSNSVMEAMASGLPVIISNVGGAKNFVKGNGFIIDSLKKLSDYVLKIDPTTMAARSRQIASEFSFEKMAAAYQEVLDR